VYLCGVRRAVSPTAADAVSCGAVPSCACAAARGHARKKQFTLGTQFKMQLADLMLVLNATDPHFVRCMKPNDLKRADTFQAHMMLAQLRYAGLLEVCRIRQIGYPVRKPFDEFLFRYRCLAKGDVTAVRDIRSLMKKLSDVGYAKHGQWQVGHHKVRRGGRD
jgi:myosin heavy subunit